MIGEQNDSPLVSVLMTAYNREQYIAEAIESVLSSDYTYFELIVVDDGSTDSTVNIVKKFAAADARIKLHINAHNLGDYPNRNKAASLAKGKYIMFCDSDDQLFDDSIRYCVEAMEANPLAKFGMYYAAEKNEPFVLNSKETLEQHFFVAPFLVMGPGGTIINRDFFISIGGYPEKFGPANDMYFNLNACSKTSLLLLPKLFLHYRLHEGQEQNNLYAYIHYNYRYLHHALNEIDMGLNEKQLNYLRNKNNRRFVTNLFNQFKGKKSLPQLKDLWIKAGFNVKSLVSGIFH